MKAMNRPYILLFNSYRLHRLCRPASMPGMAGAARTVRLTGTACPCSTAGTTGRSCPVEFRQLLLCIIAEVLRNVDFHYCVMAAECCTILHGNDTLITEPQFRAGLSTRLDGALYLAAEGLHLDLAAQHRCHEWNPHRRINVHALPLESRSCCHMDFQQQVSGFSTVCARHTFAPQTDALPVVDPCRDMDFDRLFFTSRIFQIEIPIATERRFIKGYIDIGMNIFTVLRKAAVPCTSAEAGKS